MNWIKERKLLVILILILTLGFIYPKIISNLTLLGYQKKSPSFPIHVIELTKGFMGFHSEEESSGTFTVSPDGNFIIFVTADHNDPAQIKYNVALLNLKNQTKITLASTTYNSKNYNGLLWAPQEVGGFITYLRENRNCWTANSLFCVLPPYLSQIPAYVVDLRNPSAPRYTAQNEHGSIGPSTITYKSLVKDQNLTKFTCSDCETRSGNIVQKYITQLPTFGRNPHIKYITPSPDGKYIAYQVSYGKEFVSSPDLYIFSTSDGKVRFATDSVYYHMQWSPDSHRLYFHRCKSGGQCGTTDAINYLEL